MPRHPLILHPIDTRYSIQCHQVNNLVMPLTNSEEAARLNIYRIKNWSG